MHGPVIHVLLQAHASSINKLVIDPCDNLVILFYWPKLQRTKGELKSLANKTISTIPQLYYSVKSSWIYYQTNCARKSDTKFCL